MATSEAESTARGWTEEQMRVFDKWVEAVQSVGVPKGTEDWEQLGKTTLDSWEESVTNSLRAQEELGNIVVDALGAWAPTDKDGRQDEAVRQMQEAVKSWTSAQRQAWSGFFDLARQVDTSLPTETWNKTMQAGQESLKNAWETQARWFTSFYGPTERTGPGASSS